MNVYDSQRMTGILAPLGYELTAEPAEAALIILNTCHIRDKAAEKVYSELGRIRMLKNDSSATRPLIAVAGCVAQAEGEEILARAPAVDIVVGPQAYHRLPELIARATRTQRAAIDTEFPAIAKFDQLPQADATLRRVRPFSPFKKAAIASVRSASSPTPGARSTPGRSRALSPKQSGIPRLAPAKSRFLART